MGSGSSTSITRRGSRDSGKVSDKGSATKYSWRTTSEDIFNEFGRSANGKTAIITGAASGVGYETARVLAKCGAEVIIATKSLDQGADTMNKILKEQPHAKIVCMQLDLSSTNSIWTFCNNFRRSGRLLHIIVNNASTKVMSNLTVTEDNIECQFAINYLGHFLLTLELLDIMLYSSSAVMPGRIINVSCSSNYLLSSDEGIAIKDINCVNSHYDKHEKHAASKLAMVLFTKELARRMTAKNLPIKVSSLHPGIIKGSAIGKQLRSFTLMAQSFLNNTNMNCMNMNSTSTTSSAGSMRNGALRSMFLEPMKTVEQGAATVLYLALTSDETVNGAHYSNCREDNDMVHPIAKSEAKAKELWRQSIRLTGVRDI